MTEKPNPTPAFEVFTCLLDMIDALPPGMIPADASPLHGHMPTAWPTIGDLRVMVAEHTQTKRALQEAIRAIEDGETLDRIDLHPDGRVYFLRVGHPFLQHLKSILNQPSEHNEPNYLHRSP